MLNRSGAHWIERGGEMGSGSEVRGIVAGVCMYCVEMMYVGRQRVMEAVVGGGDGVERRAERIGMEKKVG